jgi:glucosamine--fructose-6-phosphate aminotransferase (isomerizing)
MLAGASPRATTRHAAGGTRRDPGAVAATTALADEIAARAERYRYLDRLVTGGRGYCYGTAFELALKLKETLLPPGRAVLAARFPPRPVAIVDDGFPACSSRHPGRHMRGCSTSRAPCAGAVPRS